LSPVTLAQGRVPSYGLALSLSADGEGDAVDAGIRRRLDARTEGNCGRVGFPNTTALSLAASRLLGGHPGEADPGEETREALAEILTEQGP
jgi:hypothetical protein